MPERNTGTTTVLNGELKLQIEEGENIISLRYSFDEMGQPRILEQTLFGLIPTLGISYSF